MAEDLSAKTSDQMTWRYRCISEKLLRFLEDLIPQARTNGKQYVDIVLRNCPHQCYQWVNQKIDKQLKGCEFEVNILFNYTTEEENRRRLQRVNEKDKVAGYFVVYDAWDE